VPPYVVFHDRVLHQIADAKPASLGELSQIPGVGPAKLERYGADVLALVER
jgi:ATP-dependent DNA helicase RecQ